MDRGYERSLFNKQMSVMRGQVSRSMTFVLPNFQTSKNEDCEISVRSRSCQCIFCSLIQIVNLREALRSGKSPLQLIRMPSAAVMIHRSGDRGGSQGRSYRQIVAKRLPFFRDW